MTERTDGYTIRQAESADLDEARRMIMRVIEEDFGYGYNPIWHRDLDRMQETYIDPPHQALFLALDDATGAIIGATGLRREGPKSPPAPAWLSERYSNEQTVQLVRVYIARENRRRGIARRLVQTAADWVAGIPEYHTIYLHTHTHVPGAEAFWRSLETTEVYYEPETTPGEGATVHFELTIPRRTG